MDMGGCVWIGESFLWNDKWQIKLLSELFSNSHSTFYEWFKQEIITFRVSKIQKWIWGDVYEWHKVSYGMTSDR